MKIEDTGMTMAEKIAKYHCIKLIDCRGPIYGELPDDNDSILHWSTKIKMWCVNEEDSKNLTLVDINPELCNNNNLLRQHT